MRKIWIALILIFLAMSLAACSKPIAGEPQISEPEEQQPEEVPKPPSIPDESPKDSESEQSPDKDTPNKREETPQTLPPLEGSFAAMIDNHPNARPQSGLDKADIVYEFIAEGGITRFLAFFDSENPGQVGPIRSARTYYVRTMAAYKTVFSHIGGNMDALALIKKLGVYDMCGIKNAGGSYFRDNMGDGRKAPHNAYTKSSIILRDAKAKGYPLNHLPKPKTGELSLNGEQGKDLTITYHKTNVVKWHYDSEKEVYTRHINGKTHKTHNGNEITSTNIIILEMPTRMVDVPIDIEQSEINTIGFGKAIFLRNGNAFWGTWSKSAPYEHYVYQLDDGSEFLYEPGKVWIQQVNSIAEDILIK